MKRKVNRIGPATLMVSLPAKWVKEQNIKKGDELELTEQDGKLIVGGDGAPEARKTTINLQDIPDIQKAPFNVYRTLFSNAYKKGFDEIEVIFPNTNVSYKVNEAIKNLLGYEIFDQSTTRCSIRSLANEKEEEFERLVKKSFFLMKHTAQECYNDLATLENAENIKNLRDNVQKLTDFCRRLVNKKIYRNSDLSQYYYIILMRLILTTNKFADIHAYVSKKKAKKLHKDTLAYFTQTLEFMDVFCETYNKKQLKNINKIYSTKKKLIDRAEELLAKHKGPDSVVVHYLAEAVRIMYDNASQLVGLMV